MSENMRSWLFVPADSERKMTKAMAAGADVVILDLEDSIAADGKAKARETAREFLTSTLHNWTLEQPRLFVRMNDFTTPYWQEDLAAIAQALPHGIMLPKARSGDDVHRLSIALGHAEEKSKVAAGRTKIITLITEVAISLLQMQTYVGSSSRCEAFTWGAEDLSAELGSTANRDHEGQFTSPYRLVRDMTLITAAAAEIPAVDTVYIDFLNKAGLALEASMAARDGFMGKLAIHPDQVGIINAAFTPTQAEVERAKGIVAAFAATEGGGVVGFEGKMLDRPHLVLAKRVLKRAGVV